MREQVMKGSGGKCSRSKDQQVQRPWGGSVAGGFKDLLPEIIPLVINRAGREKASDRLITHCVPELSYILGQFWR